MTDPIAQALVQQAHTYARTVAPCALALACSAHQEAARAAREMDEARARGYPVEDAENEMVTYDAERDRLLALHWPAPRNTEQFRPALETLRDDPELRREIRTLIVKTWGEAAVATVHAFGEGWRFLPQVTL